MIRRGRNGAIHDKGLEGASHHAVVPNVNTVRLAWLHGSRARGTARLESDIDVAVLLDDDHAASPTAIKDSIWCLAGARGREVRSDRIDLVLLNDAPALLRHRVIRDGNPAVRANRRRARTIRAANDPGSIRTWSRVFASTPAAGWSGSGRDEQMVDTEIFWSRLDAPENYLDRL